MGVQRRNRGSGPPGKSQVTWVSIGNKQSDPPPPPPLEKVGTPGKCWIRAWAVIMVKILLGATLSGIQFILSFLCEQLHSETI